MCYLNWFVCFSTPKDVCETKISLFFLTIQPSSITLQAMQLIRYCQVSFPFFQLLRQKAQQWIRELNWNLPFTSSKNRDIRWGKSILYHAFFWTSFFFPGNTHTHTHIINHLVKQTHNQGIALPIPKGLTMFFKNVQLYNRLLPTPNFNKILAFKY